MPQPVLPTLPFGARSTADEVLAGIDLSGQTILVTGCNAGIGFETMRSLAAHGAHVIGIARSAATAREACARAGGTTTPVACDLADLASIVAAAETVHGLGRPLDAIVANAGMMGHRTVERRDGVEMQFLVNHVAHFLLLTRVADLLRDKTGRIAVVSSSASVQLAPREGIMFDNLDGHRNYRAMRFYGQSKLANALFAMELSRRLAGRGIAVNALHPGVILGTRFLRRAGPFLRLIGWAGRHFTKSIPQGAATQVLLAANPLVAGVTGQYWADCQVARGSRYLNDPAMASRLWTVTEEILARTPGLQNAPAVWV